MKDYMSNGDLHIRAIGDDYKRANLIGMSSDTMEDISLPLCYMTVISTACIRPSIVSLLFTTV